jgi:NACalpha-BTF3-like transcription factor
MNYTSLIADIKKYHYLFVYKDKCIILSSNNIAKDAKTKAIDKIMSKIDAFKCKSVIRIKIDKIKKSIYNDSKNSTITGIGGPIVSDINVYTVQCNGTLKMNESEDRNNRVYFTEEYLSKNNKIKQKDLKLIAQKAFNRKLNTSLLIVNKL